MSDIRILKPGTAYELTHTLVDREFSFRPDHRRDNALLFEDCPAEALEDNNDLTPEPSLLNIIGFAFARAAELAPIRIHSVELNLNHLHVTFSVTRQQLVFVPSFLRDAFSLIATSINRRIEREGHLFAGRPRISEVADDARALHLVLYGMTNAVKDGLTESTRRSPLFNTYRTQALGQTQRYWAIDWTAFDVAGGWKRKTHHPKRYLRWLELEIYPLPSMEAMTEEQRRTFFRKQVQDLEAFHAKNIKDAGRRFMSIDELFALDPRDRPRAPRDKTPKPRVHASTEALRKAVIAENREIEKAHRIASIAYLAGDKDVVFPEGTFKPPFLCPVWSG
ncbi:MAG: hypothetical protein MUC50_07110 [Myxococcota bacterium]|jgi:hypothetical protein|nr:hypothetical protein [Myxococcota bacterium]